MGAITIKQAQKIDKRSAEYRREKAAAIGRNNQYYVAKTKRDLVEAATEFHNATGQVYIVLEKKLAASVANWLALDAAVKLHQDLGKAINQISK